MKKLTLLFALALLVSCKQESANTELVMHTSEGDIVLELYNDTPLHRDNFIKLSNEGILDSLLFHRVIENFMIQGGDTNSKNAAKGETLGSGDLNYSIPAEIKSSHFHKKGSLAAARTNNPDRNSSSTQFYIVQGRVFNDSTLNLAEERINRYLNSYNAIQAEDAKSLKDSLIQLDDQYENQNYLKALESWKKRTESYKNDSPYSIPESHRKVYKSIGGAPHLDQSYTVFGEVTQGLDIIDKIARQPVDENDRPINDIRLLSIEITKD